jgi:uncharacterized protein
MHDLALHEFVQEHTAHFDESHDLAHAKAVHELACAIATPDSDPLVIMYAALLHDVCDTKYAGHPKTIDKAALHEYVRNSPLSPRQADMVIFVIENVSFSKQRAGRRQVPPDAEFQAHLDIVSDADKIEALGERGIFRCITYTQATGGRVPADVVVHCKEKLLRLKDDYIVTPTGKALAEPRHRMIVDYVRRFDSENLA